MAKDESMAGQAAFGKVVAQLGKATKKPAQTKAQVVLAVQVVDKSGKVIEDDKGAAAAETRREEKATQKKQTTLFEQMADGIKDMHQAFLDSIKKGAKMGLGIVFALIAAPIIALVAFFKQLAAEFMFLKKLTGTGLTKLFAPLKSLFTGEGAIGKAFTSLSKTIKGIGTSIKGSKAFVAIGEVGTKIKGVITSLGKFFEPVGRFFKTVFNLGDDLVRSSKIATTIKTFATKFGTVLGKIFLPITILMGAFDFITGFMEGYKKDGILGGLEGGLSKLFKNLIGMPLDLLKSAVSWIAGKLGFKNAEKTLDAFSFSTLITDMISGLFGMIKGAVNWIKLLFSDPVKALSKLWDTLTGGYASIMDFIWSPIKAGIAWVMRLFGWDEAAAATESFSISGFITQKFKVIKEWFINLFRWGAKKGKTAAGGFSLGLMLGGVITTVKDWFVGLFEWGAKKGETAAGGFSMGKMLRGVVKSIGGFFWKGDGTGILEFDLAGALPDFEMPDFGKLLSSMVSGMFPEEWIKGTGFIGSLANALMPQALLDILTAEPERKAIQGTPFAGGGPFSKGQSMLVGELGPELIIPSTGGQVINAQRSQQMMQAGIQRGMGCEGGGGTTSINTGGNVVSSPTTNFVSSGIAARRPIILAA